MAYDPTILNSEADIRADERQRVAGMILAYLVPEHEALAHKLVAALRHLHSGAEIARGVCPACNNSGIELYDAGHGNIGEAQCSFCIDGVPFSKARNPYKDVPQDRTAPEWPYSKPEPGPDHKRCQSNNDGECFWRFCPQRIDGEPEKSGRSCPFYSWEDD